MTWGWHPPPILVAGPCALEDARVNLAVGETLAELHVQLGLRVVFKASFDKANRAGPDAARGLGLEEGLRELERVGTATGLPVLTDIHEPSQAAAAAEVADGLQVPAFLCRQTDLLTAAGRTGKPVNIKKGQWMAAEAMQGAVDKVRRAGSDQVAVTERGTFFGYGDLVVDMRNFSRLAAAAPVLFDATHAVQRPGLGPAGASGGDRAAVPGLLAAAAAAGCDGFYVETHPEPARAISDRDTQWPLHDLRELVERTLEVWHAAQPRVGAGRD